MYLYPADPDFGSGPIWSTEILAKGWWGISWGWRGGEILVWERFVDAHTWQDLINSSVSVDILTQQKLRRNWDSVLATPKWPPEAEQWYRLRSCPFRFWGTTIANHTVANLGGRKCDRAHCQGPNIQTRARVVSAPICHLWATGQISGSHRLTLHRLTLSSCRKWWKFSSERSASWHMSSKTGGFDWPWASTFDRFRLCLGGVLTGLHGVGSGEGVWPWACLAALARVMAAIWGCADLGG